MSQEHTNPRWKQSLRTFSNEYGEWFHRFTVNEIDVMMEAAGKGSFFCDAPLRVDGYHLASFSGNHWNGNDEPFPVEVTFDVWWNEIDEEEIASLEEQVKEANQAHMDALDKADYFVRKEWKKFLSEEEILNGLIDDADDAEDFLNDKADRLGDRLDYLTEKLEEAKEGESQREQVIAERENGQWYVHVFDIPDALVSAFYQDVVAISEELRENQILLYTEKREVTA